ncbi:MAG TPA: mercuric transport protein periplasmic component, partial [Oceanospirillales bacterium]|nr:mercuric transport protein periplasmic component [Oceanospirillales bacterium]
KAEVSFEHKQAVVTFEDTQTSAGKLIEATTNAGYPSTLVETETP